MFKRIMSVMLAVVILMSVAIVAVSAETDGKVYIRVNNETCYEVEQGQTYTYVYSLACDKKISSLDCSTYYDVEGLEFLPKVDEYGDFSGAEYPNFPSLVYNFNIAGHILYNYSSVSGTRFPVAEELGDKNVVFKGEFKVTGDAGIYDIYTDLKVLGDTNNNKIIFESAVLDDTVVVMEKEAIDGLDPSETPSEEPSSEEPSSEEPSTETPSTEEPSTEEPSSEEPSSEEPSVEPAKKVQIRIDGDVVYDVEPGQVYTYTYSLACDKKISSLDCSTYYDVEGLKFLPKVDEYGDFSGAEYPNFPSLVFNHNVAGHILYNYSSVSGIRFPVADPLTEKNIVFVGEFEVTASEGIYDIWTDLKVLGDTNNNKIIFDSEVVDETVTVIEDASVNAEIAPEDPSSEEPSSEEPSSETPSSEEPSSEEPSSEEPSSEEPSSETPSTEEPSSEEPSSEEPTDAPEDPTLPEEDPSEAPTAVDPGQSSTDDNANDANGNAIQTGSTVAAIAFLTVILMAAGLVMFSRKRSNG